MKIYRSSKTGRAVSKQYVRDNADITEIQTIFPRKRINALLIRGNKALQLAQECFTVAQTLLNENK